jgi:SAM-dependent methyltransferase
MSEALLHHRTVHLAERDLDAPLSYCPVCNAEGSRSFVHRIQDEPVVDYLECSYCHACSVSRMPSKHYLENYYRNYYGEGDEQVTFRGVDRFGRHIAESISMASHGRELSILDFGGGDGRLSLHIAKLWLQKGIATRVLVTVVDFVKPQKVENESIVVSHAASLEEVAGEFDLVLASAVFEHIPELNKVLQQIFTLVVPGGFLYARTPYVLPFKKWFVNFDIYFPMHVHDLGNFFWNYMLKNLHLAGHLHVSRPSIVATDFSSEPIKTVLAYLFKIPARGESFVRGCVPDRLLWPYVGGWEVVLKKDSEIELSQKNLKI